MANIGFFVGALIPTFLIGRLLLWVLARFISSNVGRVLVANTASLIICGLVYGALEQSAFLVRGLLAYAVAQSIWLVADLVRFHRGNKKNSN
jgi:hypothetical protein